MTGSAYGYVYGNPLNGIDPLGLRSCGRFSIGGLVDCGAKAGRNAAVTAKIAVGAPAAAVTPALT